MADEAPNLWRKIKIIVSSLLKLPFDFVKKFLITFSTRSRNPNLLPVNLRDLPRPISEHSNIFIPSDFKCNAFSLDELIRLTNNFDEGFVIGEGGFGRVYRGKVGDDNDYAIKRGKRGSGQGKNEFEIEISNLSVYEHPNLVKLVGYCVENKELIIIYEYMPNGTLRNRIDTAYFNWDDRLKAVIGAAKGLAYLHNAPKPLVHRDIKSSNILFDRVFEARVSDFGLACGGPFGEEGYVIQMPKGTCGYVDPEYARTGRLTLKSDVFSFGVLLLEVLSGKKPIDRSPDGKVTNLADWATSRLGKDELIQIVDERLVEKCSFESVKRYAKIVSECLEQQSDNRPDMMKVLKALEESLSLNEQFGQYNMEETGASSGSVWVDDKEEAMMASGSKSKDIIADSPRDLALTALRSETAPTSEPE